MNFRYVAEKLAVVLHALPDDVYRTVPDVYVDPDARRQTAATGVLAQPRSMIDNGVTSKLLVWGAGAAAVIS